MAFWKVVAAAIKEYEDSKDQTSQSGETAPENREVPDDYHERLASYVRDAFICEDSAEG